MKISLWATKIMATNKPNKKLKRIISLVFDGIIYNFADSKILAEFKDKYFIAPLI
jgi:hypothetical protein